MKSVSSSPSSSLRGLARTPLSKVISANPPFSKSSSFSGFTLQKSFYLEDLQITVFDFKHEASCAQYLHLDTDDTNNAFCIGFRTPAPSSMGVTHVLEHSVLCGSSKYQVKDPFFHMTRRSFSTFMNAMTGADYTLYPFSTTNETDFQNLLSVYLDAVFNPLLREDDFLQEAHRLELDTTEKKDAASSCSLKFNGVVFNEMRGVATDPRRVFYQQLRKNLLPSTHYEYLSGGDPYEIVDMKHQDLVDFHRKYYCPRNAITITYGDLNPLESGTLKMLDEYFLAKSGGTSNTRTPSVGVMNSLVHIPSVTQWPLNKNKSWTKDESFETKNDIRYFKGPASMGKSEEQTRAAIGWTIPPRENNNSNSKNISEESPSSTSSREEATKKIVRMAFEHSLIEELLMSGPASKMYKALVSEGSLGASYSTGTGFNSASLSTPVCSFGVEALRSGVEPERVFDTVLKTIEDVCENGFGDERRTQAAIFQQELSLRHRSTSRGINLLTSAIAMSLVRSHHQQADNAENNNNNNSNKIGGEATTPSSFIETTIDPCHVFESLSHLREVSKDQSLLLKELRRCTLDNLENSVKLVVEADKDFISSKQEQLDLKCKSRSDELSSNKQNLEKHLEQMNVWKQKREIETKEAPKLAQKCLPSMKKTDISERGVEEPAFDQVRPGLFVTSKTPTNGIVYLRALIPLNKNIRQVFETVFLNNNNSNKNDDSAIDESLLQSIFLWNESHSYVTTLGTSFADAETLDTLENLCSLGFMFSPTLSDVWTNDGSVQKRLGTHVTFRTTEEKLPEATKLFGQIVREANRLSSSPSSTNESWEKSHKRFVTRLSSIASRTVAGATQRGHSLALSAAQCGLKNSKYYLDHVVSDTLGGMKHLEAYKTLNKNCSDQLNAETWKGAEAVKHPKLDFSSSSLSSIDSSNNNKHGDLLLQLAKARDSLIDGLSENLQDAVWWVICDPKLDQEKIVQAFDQSEILPSHHQGLLDQESDLTRLFDLKISSSSSLGKKCSTPPSSSSEPSTKETKIIEFPTDTSFAALAKANDELHPLHPDMTTATIASQIAKSDFMHDKIRAESGAYGNFSSVSGDGTISHVSYRDPLPKNSLDVFKKASQWLSSSNNNNNKQDQQEDNNNVNETNLEQALLRVFAGLDAPKTPASFGDRFFMHSITEEMRQTRRRNYLGASVDDVQQVGKKYFACDEGSDDWSAVIVQPESKGKDKK